MPLHSYAVLYVYIHCIDATGLPEVTVTPFSQSVEVTHTAMFTTTVRGVGVKNFMYQWRHNGRSINGSNGSVLIIPNVMESDSGEYVCIVTNQYGDVDTSNKVTLMVKSMLIISVICKYF